MPETTVQPAILVQQLTKRYHPASTRTPGLLAGLKRMISPAPPTGPAALQDISFSVPKGQTLGIIGLNGSGKSTLLSILAGIVQPTSGDVTVQGTTTAILEIGAGFHPDLTGKENALFALSLAGLTKAESKDRLPAVQSFAEIGDAFYNPVRTYSSGMFLRVAFAAAACADPDVMLIDEALAVGDVAFQQKCVRRLRDELAHTTRVIVSHDLRAISSLCDRVLVIDKGKLILDADPAEAIRTYTTIAHATQDPYAPSTSPRSPAPLSSSPCATDLSPSQCPIPSQNINHISNQPSTPNTHSASSAPSAPLRTPTPPSSQNQYSQAPELPWQDIPEDSISGLLNARITRIAWLHSDQNHAHAVAPDQKVSVHIAFTTTAPLPDLIFGYLVHDRLGAEIFGQNTAELDNGIISIDSAGEHIASFEIVWPQLKPGPYTVTFGIGQGDQALGHAVQCWAHAAIKLESVTHTPTHGLFNGSLENFSICATDLSSSLCPKAANP